MKNARHIWRSAAMALAMCAAPGSGQDADTEPTTAQADAGAIGSPDTALVGHYYLAGVMETGSELRLQPDGRFDWYISYGAVDQVASGRWGRDDDVVTLLADLPAEGAPLFLADERFDWNEDIERRLRDAQHRRAVDAILARCPWSVDAVASPMLAPTDIPTLPAQQAADAAAARSAAETARDAATGAMARAVTDRADEAEQAAAKAAMADWYVAQYQMELAYQEASLPVPNIGEPVVPDVCRIPEPEPYAAIPQAQWQRGIAVLVGDPARELRLSRVAVTFIYTDGHRETDETNRGGWAFAPLRKDAAVEQLILTLAEPVSRSETLTIAPLNMGAQAVLVDTQQIIAPAFSRLTLEVRGDDLFLEGMPRGRYSRR